MATRRRFICDCSALAATAALAPTSVLAAPRRSREIASEDLSWATFAGRVNSRFLVHDAGGQAHALDLIHAERAVDANGFVDEEAGEQFSLFFRGDAAQPLPQDTYAFEHGGIGRFAMFIVPIGRTDGRSCYYEAVFNRPVLELRAERRGPRRLRFR